MSASVWVLRKIQALAAFLLAIAVYLIASSASQAQNIIWEDFGGRDEVPAAALAGPSPRYGNYSSTPITALKSFSSNPANVIRSGRSTALNYVTADQTLCFIGLSATSPSCTIGAQGRVLWARVQFPEAGNYSFALTHDDQVDIDVSSDYNNSNFRSVLYNVPVGGLPSYSDNDTTASTVPGQVYAPLANSCGWVRIYWNNVGGANHLRMMWRRPSSGVYEIIPAARYISPDVTPTSATCAAAVNSPATSVQLVKELGSNGRALPADQFDITITDLNTNTTSSTSGSGGTSTGRVADTGAIIATVGTTYRLSEAMSAGSTNSLSLYNPSISCTRNGIPVTASGSAPNWTINVTAANQQFLCVITNQRSLIAPVAVNDSSSGQPVGSTITINAPANDTDADGGIAPGTLVLLTTGQPAGSSVSADGKRLVVPGQGVWVANPTTGAVTFTPEAGYAGNPTPARYQIRDVDNQLSNVATITITYVARADIVMSKVANSASPLVGSNITFTLNVSNRGLSRASAVVVNDLLPAGYTWISDTSAGSYVPSTGVWTVGALENGASRTLQITARVNPTGPYANTATASTPETDPVPGNNSSTVTPTPVASTDLVMTKAYSSATPQVGGTMSFTLTLLNNGPSAASGVTVTDQLPAGFTWISDTSGGSYVPATGIWTVGALPAAQTRTLTITVRVNPTGPYVNTAVARGTETDPTPSNNTSTATPLPVPVADLVMGKTVSSPTPRVGENVTFTLTLNNDGPSEATNVVVADLLPAGYTWVSDNGAGSYTASSGAWRIGTMASGTARTLSIVARVNGTGPWLNTATATLTETDPNPSNNTATATVTPVPRADLSIVKTVDDSLPIVGDTVVFTLVARNTGPSAATGVAVTDQLPSGYTFISATGAGTYAPTTGVWTIGSLANGASVQLQISARVTATGPWLNTASISGAQEDPDTSNNTSSVAPGPLPRADVYVLKTASTLTPVVGQEVAFRLVAGNNGLSTATGVVITDLLPTGFTWLRDDSAGAYIPASGQWTVGTLAATQTATINIVASVNPTGVYVNRAEATAVEPDPNSANNRSTVTLTPSPVTDLSIVKTVDQSSPATGSEATFTLTATNAGPSAATGVVVTELLPAAYTYVSHTGPGAYNPANGLWTIGNLESGGTAVLGLVVRVNPDGPYLNVATITGNEPDSNPANNSSSVVTTPVPKADLVVNKLVDNTRPNVGSNVVFTIQARNAGPSGSSAATVTDLLPAGYTYQSHTVTRGTYVPATGVWSLGSVPAGGVGAELQITATVNATGPYVNTASISGPQDDPDPSNNTSTVTPDPVPRADLSVVKSASSAAPAVGTDVTFTLNVANNGPSAATSVIVQDQLPTGYAYVSHTGPGSYVPGTGAWSLGTLPASGTAALTITARVNAAGPYGNTARVSATEADPVPANNTSTVTPVPTALADLVLVKSVNNPTPDVGSVVTFTLNLLNNGPSPTPGVVTTDLLPSGYTYVSDNAGGAYNRFTGVWTAGTLLAGQSRTMMIQARVNATGVYTNTATTTATVPDPDPSNNTSTVTPSPVPVTDLAVDKVVSSPSPAVGDLVVFTITARNLGPSDSTGVKVLEQLPSGYSYVSDTSGGRYDTGTGVWSVGDLGNSLSATFEISARVLPTGLYRNLAQISGNEKDPELTNNSAEVAPGPILETDLRVVKSASTLTPAVGAPVVFTIVATNGGPSPASEVEVTDLLPSGFTYVSSTGPGTYNPTSGLWSIGNLASGAQATLTMQAQVNAQGSYTNGATVRGDEPDPNPSNNTSSVTLTPVPQSNLALVKVANTLTPDVGSEISFTLTVTNNGPSEATLASARDVLAAGYTYISHTGPGAYNPGSGIWSIGTLPSGDSVQLVIRARVNASGPYPNTAETTARENDPDPSNNTSTVVPVPVPVSDLALVKTVSKTTPNVGEQITFTLALSNAGPSEATGVVVNDLLKAGYEFISAAGTGSYDAATGNWTVGRVAAGASRSLTLTVRVLPTGPYDNTATVTLTERDPDPSNNTSTVTPSPVPLADLRVSKTVDNASPAVGENVVFRLVAGNSGPSVATAVEVRDLLPAGYSYRSHSGDGVYSPGSGLWQPGDLASGANATLEITARVNRVGPWANTATISGAETDPIPQNNTSTVTPTPRDQADLVMAKTVSTLTPEVGQTVVFSLNVTNLGPSIASNVLVEDRLASGYTYVSDTGGGSYVASTGRWSPGSLSSGQSTSIEITARVNPTGIYSNTAQVSSPVADPDPSNNTSTVTPSPEPLADLAVVKTASNMAPAVGDEITFTLTLTNNGPSTASGIELTDLLPAGYTWLSDNSSGSYQPTTGAWSPGALLSGNRRVLEIRARVNPSGPYANTARVTGTEKDPTPSNNTSTVTPVPVPQADLSVLKTVSRTDPTVGDPLTFTLVARNSGPSSATNVQVEDRLPTGYVFVGATGFGSYNATTGIWTIGTLASGAEVQLRLNVTVAATGAYLNTARISGDQNDPNPGNNSSSVAPGPSASADLYVRKSANSLTPRVGTQVVFTLEAGNLGLSDATGVQVTERLASGYTWVSDTSGGSYNPTTGVWSVGTLAAGASQSLQITANVLSTGSYANTAELRGNEPDPDYTNNISTVTPTPIPVTDLAVSKSVSNSTPNVGESVVFTLRAENRGPSAATGVEVTDLLPSGYTYVSHSGPGNYNATSGLWQIGALANGGTAELTLTARVNPTGVYSNTALIRGAQTGPGNADDPVPSNNESTVTPVPAPVSDLSVAKSVSAATVAVGSPVTFRLTARNAGPSDASMVTVSDQLPAGYTFVSASGPGSYDPGTGVWQIGALAAGAEQQLEMVATVNAAGPYTNTAVISAPQTDPDPGNNTSTVTPSPSPRADLSVAKSVSDPTPLVGARVNFTLLVSNAGPSAATDVAVQDLLPSGYRFVAASLPGYNSTTGVWQVGSLAMGQSRSLMIEAEVLPAGPWSNTASVSGAQTDPVPGNNTSTVVPAPQPAVDLSIVKSVSNLTPAVGSEITFRLSVRNAGPSEATSVVVTEDLPAGYTLISDNSGGAYVVATGKWQVGTLLPGASRDLNLRVRVNPTGPYENTATITSPETELVPGDNTSVVTPTPDPRADLVMRKAVDVSEPLTGDTVTFTLTVENAGPSEATSVIVSDQLPAGYTYLTDNTGGDFNSGTGFWSVGTLAVGAQRSMTLTARIAPSGPYLNTARASAAEIDPVPANNEASVAPGPLPRADLSIVKSHPAGPYDVGSEVTFELVARNAGVSNATGVFVTDQLPTGYTFVRATPSVGAYNSSTGIWTIGALLVGASETLEVVARIKSTGDYTNVARIQGNEPDNSYSNNTSTNTVTPVDVADLVIAKSVNDPRPPVGGEVVFTLDLTNLGPSEATGISVTDRLPSGYSYISHSGPGSYTESSGTWLPGDLRDGESVTLQIRAKVLNIGTYANTATVSATQKDPDPSSNTSTVTPTPQLGTLAIGKWADVAQVTAPGAVNFTISVENTGVTTVPRDQLTLTDTLTIDATPTIVVPVYVSGDTLNDGLLSPGETWIYSYTYNVTQADINAGHPLRNVASVSSSLVTGTVTTPTVEVLLVGTARFVVEKTARAPTRLVPGETIVWDILVRNTGNVTLDIAPPTDTLTTVSGTPRSLTTALTFDATRSSSGVTATALPPGTSQIWTATSVLTQADIDGGGLNNVVSVTAASGGGRTPITATDTAIVATPVLPSLAVVKTAALPARLVAGEVVNWQVVVRNSGNTTLLAGMPADVLTSVAGNPRSLSTGLTFDTGASFGGATDTQIPVGGSQVWVGTSVLTQADIDEGGLRNIATATATTPSGTVLTASHQADALISPSGGIRVEKTAQLPTVMAAGETVVWTVRVENTGNLSLTTGTPVDVLTSWDGTPQVLTSGLTFDAALSLGGATSTSLPVGGVQIWTGSSLLTQAQIDAGGLINTATVTATPPGGLPPLVANDRADAPVAGLPGMTVVKTGTLPSVLVAGETVTWSVRVENTGNVSLTIATPIDRLTTLTGDTRALTSGLTFDPTASLGGATDVLLPVGGAQVWTGTYLITQADLDAGGLRNTAEVVATPPGTAPPLTESSTVDLPFGTGPAFTLEKTAELPAELTPGSVITWVVTLTNTGNVTLTSGPPTDTLSAMNGEPRSLTTGLVFDATRSSGAATDTQLAPGARQVWTGTSVLTQADIDAGGLRNIAEATATPPGGLPPITQNHQVDVPILATPRLEVTKAADRGEVTEAGPLGFTITLRNTGNISFASADLEVGDRLQTSRGQVNLAVTGPDPAGDLNGDGRFDPSETWVYRATYDVEIADLDASGILVNVAHASVPRGPHLVPEVLSAPVTVALRAEPAGLRLEKVAGVQTAMIGDPVPYTIRMTNIGGQSLELQLTDHLPADFSFRTASARLDGEAISPSGSGRMLTLERVRINPGQTRVFTYQTVVGSSARPGNHTNRAKAYELRSGKLLAPESTATVKVIAEAVFHCATVLGRVFDDRDHNGDMGRNGEERGLPNVRLVAPNGLSFLTDAHGRYNVPCAAMPRAIGGNFMLKLDERTLPSGYRVTTENPRVVRLTPGMITRLDFGATLPPVVRVDLAARAFGPDTAGRDAPKIELNRGLQALVAEIRNRPSMVEITYLLSPGETEATAKARLNLIENRLKQLWHGTGSYKLTIETRMDMARAQR